MLKTHRWWLALAFAIVSGCAGEESNSPAGGGPAVKEPPKAAPKIETPAPPSQPAPTPAATPATKPPTDAAPKGASKSAELPDLEGPKVDASPALGVKLTDDEIAEIKKLPAADQALAMKQALCPVSDEHLGGMDVPIKVSASGRTFFLCCKSCEAEVKKDPQAVIAKLDKK